MAIGGGTAGSPLEPTMMTPGGVPRTMDIPEAASFASLRGFLVLESSGSVEDPTAGQDMGAVIIYGILNESATGTTGTLRSVEVPDFNSEIRIRVSSSGTLETANTTAVLGTNYDIYVGANGECTLNSATTTNPKLTIIEWERDVNSDIGYWCICRPVAATWAALDGS